MAVNTTAVLSNATFSGNFNGWESVWGEPSVSTLAISSNGWVAYTSITSPQGAFKQRYIIPASFGVGSGNASVRMNYHYIDQSIDGDQATAAVMYVNSSGQQVAGWVSSIHGTLDTDSIDTNTSDIVPLPQTAYAVELWGLGKRLSGTVINMPFDSFELVFDVNSQYVYDLSPVNEFDNPDTASSHNWKNSYDTWTYSSNPWDEENIDDHVHYDYNLFNPLFQSPTRFPFYPAPARAVAGMYQFVHIPNTGDLYSNWIDTGSATFEFRFNYAITDANVDRSYAQVQFLDSEYTALGSIGPGAPISEPATGAYAPGRVFTYKGTMPASTRILQYDMTFIRSSGTRANGLIGGLSGVIGIASPINPAGGFTLTKSYGYRFTAAFSNSDFAAGSLGTWTSSSPTPPSVTDSAAGPVAAKTGTYFLFGGTGTRAEFYQDVPIPSSVFVGSGDWMARLNAWVNDLDGTDSDEGALQIHLVNSAGEIAAGHIQRPTNKAQVAWRNRTTDLIPIPPNTAKLRVGAEMFRRVGTQLNWYLDSVSIDYYVSTVFYRDVSPVNKDLSNDTNSWVTSLGTWSATRDTVGTHYTAHGIFPKATVARSQDAVQFHQVVDVSVNSDWIDTGSTRLEIRYKLMHPLSDNGNLEAWMYDASSTVVSTFGVNVRTFGAADNAQHPTVYKKDGRVPSGTRAIRYNVDMILYAGTDLDAYMTGFNGILIQPQQGAASSSGPAQSTMRFGVTNAHQPTGTTVKTETYSLDAQPVVRFGIMTANNTHGFTSDGAHMSMGIYTYSSNNNKVSMYWAGRVRDGGALDVAVFQNNAAGPGVVNSLSDTVYRQNIASADTNVFVIQRALTGFEFTTSTAYHANVWAGSFSSAPAVGNFSDVVSTELSLTYGFQPDLIFAWGNYGDVVGGTEVSGHRYSLGVWDCVNSKAQFMGHAHWSFSNTVRWPIAHSNEGWFNIRFNPVGFRQGLYLGSVGATGATFVVNTAFNTSVVTTGLVTNAFKFHDTNVHWKLWQIYVDANTPGYTINSIQTNSLVPLWGYFMGSQMRSMNTIGSSADPANGCFGIGFWVGSNHGQGQSTILSQDERNLQNNASFTGSSTFLNPFDFVGGVTWFCRSGVSGDNGFSFSAYTNTPGDHDKSVLQYLLIGDVRNAPSHLMDASSSSIFLADASDYDDNLLLVTAAESSGGGNTPTMKFGHDTYLVSTLDTVETYSELTGVPQFRFSMMTGTSQLNAVDDDGRISIGMMSISSDLTQRSVVTAYRNQDGSAGAVLANYHLVGSTNGPGVIDPSAASFVTQTEVQSVGSALIRNKALTGAGSYGFAAFSWTGSFYNRVGQLAAPVNIANVGSAEIFSTDMTPQLLFMSISHTNTGNGFKSTGYDENTLTFGFYDTRSSLGRYINFGHSGAGADTVMAFLSDQMVKVNCGDDGIGNYWMDVASVSASGLFVKVTSVPLALSDRTQVAISAFSFLDSATNYKIGDFVLPTSSEAASIAFDFTPRFAMFLATDNKSINCIPASEGSFGRGDGFSIGFWSNSTEMSYAAYNQQGAASGVNNKTILGNSVAARITQGDNALIAEIGSVTATSDSLVFYSDVFTTVGQATRMSYLVIGDSQAAVSSDPGSAAAAAGGALFRKFPDTDDRQFPTPLTNVRAFPSD